MLERTPTSSDDIDAEYESMREAAFANFGRFSPKIPPQFVNSEEARQQLPVQPMRLGYMFGDLTPLRKATDAKLRVSLPKLDWSRLIMVHKCNDEVLTPEASQLDPRIRLYYTNGDLWLAVDRNVNLSDTAYQFLVADTWLRVMDWIRGVVDGPVREPFLDFVKHLSDKHMSHDQLKDLARVEAEVQKFSE